MAVLRYTDSAENDLLEAWHLPAHPRMGRERPDLADGLRSWPTTTPYILFYFGDVDGVVIARVLHRVRDIGAVDDWPPD